MKNITLISLILFTFNVSFALEAKRLASANRTTETISVDGVLNESAWLNVIPANDFVQLDPENGKPETFKTEARFLYDDNAIYIGVMMFDSSPDSIQRQLTTRDEINQSDFFGIYIDPFNDGLTAYGFFVTAAGVQIDMKAQDNEDPSWDAVWESEVKITDDGWIVEIKIPYSALRFPSESVQTWGVNMFRYIQRTKEKTTWNLIDKNIDGFINQSGELNGIYDITPPLRLSIMPYLSAYVENNSENNSWSRSIKGGLDLKYGVNESFTLDLMLIPDFGQVQSDDKILNLTPFETYYEEKRQFFTEGTELFNKGEIFYSRRIGSTPNLYDDVENNLNPNEEIISNRTENQLINATKLTGRTNSGTGIGFLNAMTIKSEAVIEDTLSNENRNFTTQPFTNYNVLVFDQSLKNNSYVSLINTNVSRFEDKYYANVTATDIKLSNAEKTYSLGVKAGASQIFDRDLETEIGGAYSVDLSKTSGQFRFILSHYLKSDKFNPNDLGYSPMNNVIGENLNLQYNFYNPFGRFMYLYNNVNLFYESVYNPNAYGKFEIAASSLGTFKNYLTVGVDINASLKNEHSYYETRVTNRYYKVPLWRSYQIMFSTDYRKKFAFDVWQGYWSSEFDNYGGFWMGFSPRLRASDKLFFVHRFALAKEENKGYVDNFSDDEIYFGNRIQETIENSLSVSYIFNNKQGISLKARHYWAKADYDKFYFLEQNGELTLTQNYTDNPNINYNTFTLDFVYSWNFAPGSEISVVWKNLISSADENIINSYSQNIQNTFSSPQINNFSVKILYYIDYLYVKNLLK